MAKTAKKTDPNLWQTVKKTVTQGERGGRAGQWSARKAQLAVSEYKKRGGGYEGPKSSDNHLRQWTDQDWGTRSGRKSEETGERYLPRKAREHLTDAEYCRTTEKKRADTSKGRQFSRQPEKIARKTAKDRRPDLARQTKASLLQHARDCHIPGRSKMSKSQLIEALR